MEPRDYYKDRIGEEIAVSGWLTVEQEEITQFANMTGDTYFIHVDPQAAKETPFGTTIAHGFWTLSMLSHFARESLPQTEGIALNVNYGLEKVRFIEPVKCGARIRGRFKVLSVEEKEPGQRMTRLGAMVEIDGVDRPALVADWLTLAFLENES